MDPSWIVGASRVVMASPFEFKKRGQSGTEISELVPHIGGIAEVRRQFDVPVYLHPLDLPYYTTLSARAAQMYAVSFEQTTTDPFAPNATVP